jgi:hypothetical protein
VPIPDTNIYKDEYVERDAEDEEDESTSQQRNSQEKLQMQQIGLSGSQQLIKSRKSISQTQGDDALSPIGVSTNKRSKNRQGSKLIVSPRNFEEQLAKSSDKLGGKQRAPKNDYGTHIVSQHLAV